MAADDGITRIVPVLPTPPVHPPRDREAPAKRRERRERPPAREDPEPSRPARIDDYA